MPSGASPTTLKRPSISSIFRRRTRYSSRSSASRTVIMKALRGAWCAIIELGAFGRMGTMPHLDCRPGPNRWQDQPKHDERRDLPTCRASAGEADLGDRPEGDDPVHPADLLALLARPGFV